MRSESSETAATCSTESVSTGGWTTSAAAEMITTARKITTARALFVELRFLLLIRRRVRIGRLRTNLAGPLSGFSTSSEMIFLSDFLFYFSFDIYLILVEIEISWSSFVNWEFKG